MEELVQLVSDRTGLSEEMSKVAVDTVIDYLKDKLPAPIAGQIDLAGRGTGRDALDPPGNTAVFVRDHPPVGNRPVRIVDIDAV